MEKYLKLLQDHRSSVSFNPWAESDSLHDIGNDAPKIRITNLKKYLEARQNATYLLIAEALSYQGGHFTGIAMTSERQLLNDFENRIFVGEKLRTSCINKLENKTIAQKGFTENTGTIVWNAMTQMLNTYDWINWNCFPFHPYKENQILTNRTPNEKEVIEAKYYLSEFLKVFPNKKIIAIGNYSELVLNSLGEKFIKVRHPANGGAGKFRNQVADFIKNN